MKLKHPKTLPTLPTTTSIPSGAIPIIPDVTWFVNTSAGTINTSGTPSPGDDQQKYHFTLPDNLDTGHVTEVYAHNDTTGQDIGAVGGSTGPSFVYTQQLNASGTFDTLSFSSLTLN